MPPINSIIICLLFGLASTCTLHLAKAMERHGIEIFNFKKSFKEKGKKPLIYIIGLVFNNIVVLWQILGLMFGPAAVFSSVFGIGLIILMLYSHYILKEDISKIELFGAILIILGTTAVGFLYIIEPSVIEEVNYDRFYFLIIIIVIVFSILLIFSFKTNIGVAFIFGAIAGSFGGIDNVLKRIGLKAGFMELINSILSLSQEGIIFLFSLISANLAFLITQIGFGKKADASKLVPMYNSFYIIMPIIFELVIFDNVYLSIWKILAIGVIIIGIFLMNLFTNPEKLIIQKIEKT
ncbi:MAG: hypothetical protein ACTSVV_04670 [Promethearchaeota archaeon]